MADKSINVFFNTNIQQVLDKQEKLNKMFAQQMEFQDMSNVASQTQLGYLYKQKDAWDQVRLTSDLTADELEQIDTSLTTAKKSLAELENPFTALLQTALPFGGMLTSQVSKIGNLATAFSKIQTQGGFFKVMTDYLGNFSKNMLTLSGSFAKTFGGGMSGMITRVGAGLKSLIPIAKSLILALGPYALIIAGVVAAIFVLKRMWVNNIGGMQTYWHRFMGSLKDTWNKFVVLFDSMLRKLSPVFKILFTGIFVPLIGVVKLLGGLLTGILNMLSPIFDAISEVGKAFLEPFEELTGATGQNALNFFDLLAKGLGFLGTAIGYVIKFVLKPIVFILKLAAMGIGVIVSGVIALKDKLMALLAPFKWILDIVKKVMGVGKDSAATESVKKQPLMASQVVSNRNATVNNNSNVTVNSAGPITADNAPQVGNMISSSIIQYQRVS